MQETLAIWGIGLAVTVGVATFARFCPKQKLMDKAGPMMFKTGKALSLIGNTKLGKKAMDKLEEGVLVTIISIFVHGLTELSKGFLADNEKDSK